MLSSWARKRKLFYALILFLIILVIVFFAIYLVVSSIQPNCYDGRQNQGETAPDRGGPCKLLDDRLLSPLNIKWVKVFPVRDQVVSALAYIDNPNADAGVMEFEYKFLLYDKDYLLVAEKEGKNYILPGMINPILETTIDTSRYDVKHALFKFKDKPNFYRMRNPVDHLKIKDLKLYSVDEKPKIEGIIENTSIFETKNIELIGIVYDPYGNAFAVSKTFIDRLKDNQEKHFTFSWNAPFKQQIGRVDVIPRITPDLKDLIGK